MDWTQASGIEWFVFSFGALMLLMLVGLCVAVILFFIGSFVVQKIERFKRLKKTTRALRCDVCIHNVYDRNFRKCEKFGCSISFAPVICPGCSWGTERKEGGDE